MDPALKFCPLSTARPARLGKGPQSTSYRRSLASLSLHARAAASPRARCATTQLAYCTTTYRSLPDTNRGQAVGCARHILRTRGEYLQQAGRLRARGLPISIHDQPRAMPWLRDHTGRKHPAKGLAGNSAASSGGGGAVSISGLGVLRGRYLFSAGSWARGPTGSQGQPASARGAARGTRAGWGRG